MAIRESEATWKGNLQEGSGTTRLGSGLFEGPYTYASRFEEGEGSNPEELVAAAHASCFSMFLASILSKDGFVPTYVHTVAKVHLGRVDGAPTITTVELDCNADVPNIEPEIFLEYAERAKAGCPVSKALACVGVMTLQARLDR